MTLSRQALSLGTKPYYGPLATILLNGVAYDAANVTDDNDKLTFRGGSSDALNVNLAAGDDLYEVDAEGENITNATMRGGEGDDVISVVAGDQGDDDVDFINSANIGGSLIGGPGEDTITVGDGIAVLTGTIKGNEDDDFITVANADGGFVQGNSGDDSIFVGFADNADGEAAGSNAAASLNNSSINGSAGDDQINIDAGGSVTDSTIRGNEGDDVIVAGGIDTNNYVPGDAVEGTVTAAGAVALEGNAGDDFIDGSAITGAAIIRGGKGDDTLIAGNGQTVFGGLGADTFTVGSAGGVFIEDFDKLDLDGNVNADDPDCFCDDEIAVQNISFETHTYDVERVKYTSASSWTGDIKVKAVANAAGNNDTARVTLAATKTETINAIAVARLFITETKTSLAQQAGEALGAYAGRLEAGIPEVTFTNPGFTKGGKTFANGLAGAGGIGGAFAQAEGYWTQNEQTVKLGTANERVYGAVRNVIAQTNTNFDKPDFSFLQLKATNTVGVETNQKLVFSDITNATVKNHWASYNKVKETNTNNLYTMNFGTANFDTVTLGKAFMVVTEGIEDKAYTTKTLDVVGDTAKAQVTLDLENTFVAWHKNLDGTGSRNSSDTFDGLGAPAVVKTSGGARVKTGSWDRLTGNTAAGNQRFVVGGAVVSAATAPALATDTLTSRQLFYSTVVARGLATLSVTARNTGAAGLGGNPGNSELNIAANPGGGTAKGGITQIVGTNNTGVRKDDFATVSSKLVMKIAVSETATAKASKALGTIVERTTIFGEDIPITTCPDFPTVSSLATRQVDGQAKHGDVVGTFNNRYLWADRTNNIRTVANATDVVVNNFDATFGTPGNASELKRVLAADYQQIVTVGAKTAGTNVDNNNAAGEGFFSASAFTAAALEAQGFGNVATAAAGNTDAQNVPFRVLFFDNDAASNGLYIMSGTANYNNGALTALNTNPMMSSAMGGKHTIVKVTGGKGSVIELSDINLV